MPSGEPGAQLVVDRRVVEQREVAGAAEVHAVLLLEGDPAGAAAARGARLQHERVADQAAERMAIAAGDGRRDEAVGGALEQRDLRARGRLERVRIAVAPVLVHERTPAEVADAAAATAQEVREGARLREPREARAEHVN